jgi:hypothetical protein
MLTVLTLVPAWGRLTPQGSTPEPVLLPHFRLWKGMDRTDKVKSTPEKQ